MKADEKPRYSRSGHDVTPLPQERVEELARGLDREAFRVTQEAGTERAFTGALLANKRAGVYACVVCGLPLYPSTAKFDSGTGWPSFTAPVDEDHVAQRKDNSHGMVRTEILCARCAAHLGHVFPDGPRPTGMRHCLNSAALRFHAEDEPLPPESRPVQTETAYFAGGCFWGIEHYFALGPGVLRAVSGYMQGHVDGPTYEQVCTGRTGHAETVMVVFDPDRITYRRLLEAFFAMHDPTQRNRQGPDVGTQYRSGIWYTSERQKREAEEFVARLRESEAYRGRAIVTELEEAKAFWAAEDDHQGYIARTGRACHVRNPW